MARGGPARLAAAGWGASCPTLGLEPQREADSAHHGTTGPGRAGGDDHDAVRSGNQRSPNLVGLELNAYSHPRSLASRY